jgi:2-dehydro-3-deoxygluconokinase
MNWGSRILDVVTLGETMVLFAAVEMGPLRFANTFEKHLAGSEANVAIGLARLGHRSGWISRVGDDEFGQYLLYSLRGEGVDVSRVGIDPNAPTGVLFKEKREIGARRIVYYRKDSAASRLTPGDLDADYIGSARFLHLSGITPALSASAAATVDRAIDIARERDVTVSFDPNVRLRLWDRETCRIALRRIIPRVDICLPGAEEAELLTGETDPLRAAAQLRDLGARLVVVKVGADGAIALDGEREVRAPAAMRLDRIVDPVGAGDGFAAGFLSGLLRGYDLPEALRLGNTVGAFAMTVVGDVEGLPTWREVQEFRPGQDVAR